MNLLLWKVLDLDSFKPQHKQHTSRVYFYTSKSVYRSWGVLQNTVCEQSFIKPVVALEGAVQNQAQQSSLSSSVGPEDDKFEHEKECEECRVRKMITYQTSVVCSA